MIKQVSGLRRVVITGTAIIAPLGIGTPAFWQNALAGVNGIREISLFDTKDIRTNRGGEVRDFRPEDFLPRPKVATMGRASQFAVAAARMAIEEAELDMAKVDPWRMGVSMGTTMGEPQILLSMVQALVDQGYRNIPQDLPHQFPCHRISDHIAGELRLGGPVEQIPTACAAGNYAIGRAAQLIATNRADVMLAGGSDAFSRIAFVGFNKLLAASPDLCRPFDKDRQGMVVAEGSGVLVLEALDDALQRGAPILAEYRGLGLGCDAFKMTIPHPEGLGGVIAMRKALQMAQIRPDQVDYICAHGTGTKENDRTETNIIKEALGIHAHQVPISSVKSMIGHSMGASSAIEAIVCSMAIKDQIIPPTINYETPDPECDLDYVPNMARKKHIEVALSNAYAFGGNTSTLALAKVE